MSIHVNIPPLAHRAKPTGNSRILTANQYELNRTSAYMLFFHTNRWDEMGIFDIPSEINYILAKTGKAKLSYIG